MMVYAQVNKYSINFKDKHSGPFHKLFLNYRSFREKYNLNDFRTSYLLLLSTGQKEKGKKEEEKKEKEREERG